MRPTRRHFLRTAAGATLALPFLPSLHGDAAAGGIAAPKRLIILLTANGQKMRNFWPDVPDGAWTQRASDVREIAMADLPDPMSRVFGSEFAPVRDKMMLIRGLDSTMQPAEGHQREHTLTGWEDGGGMASIDQIVAASDVTYPTEPPLRSAHLITKPKGQTNGVRVAFTHNGTGIEPLFRPSQVFEQLFAGFVPPDPNAEPDPKFARRVRVLDQVAEQYQALRNNPRLGSADRDRLDEHMELIDNVQARLEAEDGATAACTVPTIDDSGEEPQGFDHLPDYTQMQIDLIEAAVKCDRTRVIVYQLCQASDTREFPWIAGSSGDHHGTSHLRYSQADYAEQALGDINGWYGQQVAKVLTALDTEEDPVTGATFLDNSLVYWGNEDAASGPQGDAHLQWGFPVMLAGSAGGAIQPGRHIDYRRIGTPRLNPSGDSFPGYDTLNWGDYVGRPYNELLVSIVQAMGLSPAEYDVHGGPGLGEYRISHPGNGYDVSDKSSMLPFLAG
ncbi:MAG: DUF1552 domain-containing protein [Myxococcota bacterium]